MYNEFLRFVYNKKRYGFDSFSDGLYLVIFLCGTLLILKGNPEVNLFLYLLFFAFTNMKSAQIKSSISSFPAKASFKFMLSERSFILPTPCFYFYFVQPLFRRSVFQYN